MIDDFVFAQIAKRHERWEKKNHLAKIHAVGLANANQAANDRAVLLQYVAALDELVCALTLQNKTLKDLLEALKVEPAKPENIDLDEARAQEGARRGLL